MLANDHQIGGTHYSVLSYQHWDWVQDAGLTYLQGQATKYLARYPQTGKLEDLRKALHYVEKLQELKSQAWNNTERFLLQFRNRDIQDALHNIAFGTLRVAANRIEELISAHSAAPVPLTEETHHGERSAQPELQSDRTLDRLQGRT